MELCSLVKRVQEGVTVTLNFRTHLTLPIVDAPRYFKRYVMEAVMHVVHPLWRVLITWFLISRRGTGKLLVAGM